MMLTAKQKAMVDFIDVETKRNGGVCPSHTEIKEALGFRSKGQVTFLLKKCEERGAVRLIPGRSRAIEVIHPKGQRAAFFRFDEEDKTLKPLRGEVSI